MAASKSQSQVRSNSFPSEQHPLIQECNEQLRRLGASGATSSSSLSHKLGGLKDFVAKDAVLHTKECAREIQSIIRRRTEVGLACEIKKYTFSRKVVKRAITNALKNLKGDEIKPSSFPSANDNETMA
ncbi:hypothetical protein PanWU01x14_272100 [Parasponia andersonii]|uniref:Uncharacterized protein n=1 Tax=Parasponia andersonii TaxID=3476 RepID=A0A2P5B4F9_PARAD|nr:hypothetical protein PanWU01x14_272100 [Parasponia andersonii]